MPVAEAQSNTHMCAALMVPVGLPGSKDIAAWVSQKFLETTLICPFQRTQGSGFVRIAMVLQPKPAQMKKLS